MPPVPVISDPVLKAYVAKLAAGKFGLPVGSPASSNYGGFVQPDLSNYVPQFNAPTQQAIKQTGISQQKVISDPATMKILQQLNTTNAKLMNPENTHKRTGFFSRAMDILQRPMYAMAEGAKEAGENVTKGKGIEGALSGFGAGAFGGLEGKHKTDFIQVLQEVKDLQAAEKKMGVPTHSTGTKAAQALAEAKANPGMGGKLGILGDITGGVLDIVGDPSTYLGVGLVSKAGKAIEASSAAVDALKGIKSAENLSQESKDLITGVHYASGKLSQIAAKSSIDKVHSVAHDLAKQEGLLKYNQVLHETVAGGKTAAQAKKTALEAQKLREGEVSKNILDHYNNVVGTPIPKQIGIGLAGKHGVKVPFTGTALGGTKIPIPLTEYIGAAAKGAASKVDVVQKGMASFNRLFRTSANIAPELHGMKLNEMGQAAAASSESGRALRHDLNPLGATNRKVDWLAALNDHPSGRMITNKNGEKIDSGTYMRGHIHPVILGTHEADIGPKEMNRWAPHGFEMTQKMITNDKGEKVADPNWVVSSMKDWNEKDGGKALWVLHHTYNNALAFKGLTKSAIDTFGIRTPEAFKALARETKQDLRPHISLAKDLRDNKGWKEVRGIPELKGHLFEPQTADNLHSILTQMYTAKDYGRLMRGIGKSTRPLKFAMTLPNPSFHWHNAIGDAFINHLDRVSSGAYQKAASVLKNRTAWFRDLNPAEGRYPLMSLPGDPMENALKQRVDGNLIKNRYGLKSADGSVNPYIKHSEVYAGYNLHGLRQNMSADYGFHSKPSKLNDVLDKLTSASETREDYFRMAHFIHLIETNPSRAKTLKDAMEYAGRRVRDTHFDYTDFTPFEKGVMSNVIPFYKWIRKATPLMTQTMLTNPGQAIIVPKIMRTMAALSGVPVDNTDVLPNLENGIVPQWMMQSGYVPVANSILGRGNPTFGYVSNPFTDFLSQQGNSVSGGTGGAVTPSSIGSTVLDMSNPYLKMIAETIFNKNTFTGGKLINSASKQSKLMQVLDYLATQVPQANATVQATQKGNIGSLISLLGPMSTQEDTPLRVRSELLRQRDVARALAKKEKASNSWPTKITGK